MWSATPSGWTMIKSNTDLKPDLKAWRFIVLAAYFFLLCWIGFYAFPNEDDYAYANLFRAHNLWDIQSEMYFNWSGRYLSNCTIAAMTGFNDSPRVYHMLPGVMMTVFLGLLFGLVRELNKARSFRLNAFITLTIFAGFLAGLKSLNESLYFLAGSFTYFWGMIFSLAVFLLLLRLHGQRRLSAPAYLALCACIILGAGTNEITTLFMATVTALPALLALLKKDRLLPALLPLALLSAACLFASYLAPGNFVRAQTAISDKNMAMTISQIFTIFGIAVSEMCEFTGRWLFLTPLLPMLWVLSHLLDPKGDWRLWPGFRLRGNLALGIVLWLGFTFAGIFITCYALSGALPSRTLAVIQFYFVSGAFFVFLTAFGSIRSLLEKRLSGKKLSRFRAVFLVFLVMFLLQKNVSLPAWNLISGNYGLFRQGYLQRTEAALSHQDRDLLLDRLPAYPYPVFYRELRTDPDNWANRAYAQFWKLRSVRIRD